MRKRPGFTLVETTLVLAILAMLAAAVTLQVRGPLGQCRMSDLADRLAQYDYLTRQQAIESGRLITGMSSSLFKKTYGEPSVIVPERTGGTRWVYKPAEATYFAGEKLLFLFDDNGTLMEYRVYDGGDAQ